VLSVIFLDERFTAIQAMGGVLILVSALLAMERPRWPRPTYTA
jgi:drug/metabolite transporter (DMT)-like permease